MTAQMIAFPERIHFNISLARFQTNSLNFSVGAYLPSLE